MSSPDPFTIADHAVTRLGAMQRREELVPALERVVQVEPKVIVEIGSMTGGTLWVWRQLCDTVYAITLPVPNPDCPISYGAVIHKGDSHAPATLAWLTDELAGRPVDVLHIDGDHTYDGVRADYDMYAPFVRDGGLILLHDIANTRDPDMGVPQFWGELDGESIVSPRSPLGIGIVTKGKPQ